MTTKGSQNRFPSLTAVGQASDPATPSTGDFKLFVADDGTFYLMDDTGAKVDLTASSGFTNPMTTAEDIIYGGASGVPTRKAKGSNDTFLGVNAGALAYRAVTDALLSTSDITTNDASTSKHGFLKKLDGNAAHYLDGSGAFSTPGGSGSLSSSQNALGADVTLTTAGTWYTGPTLTLAAGTWLLIGVGSFSCSNKTVTMRLHDGTNSLASSVTFCVSGGNTSLPVVCIVTPSGSTTYNLQATPQSNGGTFLAASAFNGVGNNASILSAVKIA